MIGAGLTGEGMSGAPGGLWQGVWPGGAACEARQDTRPGQSFPVREDLS